MKKYTCQQCSKEFLRSPSSKAKFCSRNCYWLSKQGKPSWNKGISGNWGYKKGHPQYNSGKTHFKKGMTPWNKEKKLHYDTWNKGKGKNSPICPDCGGRKWYEAQYCRKCFPKYRIVWNKGKKCKQLSGENHYLYKGTTPLNKSIRNSAKYIAWRKQIFERDNYTCQMCGKRGGRLAVDHYPLTLARLIDEFKIKTIEDAFYCDALWDTLNNRTLCQKCHLETENFGKRNSPVGREIQQWQRL